jgi:hypothetical protein
VPQSHQGSPTTTKTPAPLASGRAVCYNPHCRGVSPALADASGRVSREALFVRLFTEDKYSTFWGEGKDSRTGDAAAPLQLHLALDLKVARI